MAGGGGSVVSHEHPQDAMSRRHAVTERESSDLPTFQEAFAAAKREHSAPAEEAADTEASTDDDEPEEAEGDEDAEEAEEGEGEGEEAKPAATAKGGKDKTPGLLSDEEYAAIQTKHADDPTALRRALESAFTKKTQALAAERRSHERLQPYADLIDAYEADAEGTLSQLAEQHGFKLVKPGEAAADTEEEVATGTTAEQLAEELRGELGEEYDYLVDPLSRALSKVADKLVNQRVEAQTKPIKDQQAVIIDRAAQDETKAVMAAFDAKHPDWKDHEDAMFEIAQTLDPKGLTEVEYLEKCYTLATHDAWEKDRDASIAAAVKKALAKTRQAAVTTETQTRATPASEVRVGPPQGRAPTFEESYEAAKRGERWE